MRRITMTGRLTRDPEYRSTQTGLSVANFSVAVDRDFPGPTGEKETDFMRKFPAFTKPLLKPYYASFGFFHRITTLLEQSAGNLVFQIP